MSRDRLAAARARQQVERTGDPPRHPQDPQEYGYVDGAYGTDAQQSQYPPQTSYDDYGYGGQEQQQLQQRQGSSAEHDRQPQYQSRPQNGGNSRQQQRQQQSFNNQYEDHALDEDARGSRARERRRTSIAPTAAQQRQIYTNDGYVPNTRAAPAAATVSSQRQQQMRPPNTTQQAQYPAGLPTNPRSQGQQRMDSDDGYAQQNAINGESSSPYDNKKEERGYIDQGYPPGQHQTYNIPALPHGQQQHRQANGQKTLQQPTRQQSYYSPAQPGTPRGPNGEKVTTDAPEYDMTAFFDEIQSIRSNFRDLEQHISWLDGLHSRALNASGSPEADVELQQASDQTRKLTNSLRQRIKELQETTRIRTHGQKESDRQTRKVQIAAVREKFLDTVQLYQSMEMKNRDKAKQRIERQYQIVKPDATPEEIREVVNSGQEVQIFSQALRNTHRVGQAQNVLNEVQSRHEDIKKIERTLVELFQLLQDMAIAVEEQDEQIVHIEQTAEAVAVDMHEGHKQIELAKTSAQKARKKRKICFCIIVVLLLVIGGVVAYLVVKVIIPKINEGKANDAAAKTVTATPTVTKASAKRNFEGRGVACVTAAPRQQSITPRHGSSYIEELD